MEHVEQALKYIEKCNIYIFANGALLDQAKLHYLYAKCLHLLDKTKSECGFYLVPQMLTNLHITKKCVGLLDLDTSIAHMRKCIEKLESIEASVYLVSAYAYMVCFLYFRFIFVLILFSLIACSFTFAESAAQREKGGERTKQICVQVSPSAPKVPSSWLPPLNNHLYRTYAYILT